MTTKPPGQDTPESQTPYPLEQELRNHQELRALDDLEMTPQERLKAAREMILKQLVRDGRITPEQANPPKK